MGSGFGGMLELDLQVGGCGGVGWAACALNRARRRCVDPLDAHAQVLNITPQQAGWVGFAGTLAGNIAGVALCRVVDKMRRIKGILVGVLCASAACYAVFTLYVQQIFPAAWYDGNAPFITTLLLAMVRGGWEGGGG
jgi:hypothetical protein